VRRTDPAIALCAPLDGVIAAGSLRCERTRLDPIGRHTGLDPRVTTDGDTALAPSRVVLIGAAKEIGGAIDPETHGRVLPHIGRDLGRLVRQRMPPGIDSPGVEQNHRQWTKVQ